MRNTKRFGKVKTKEEYQMLCRLQREVKPEQKPKKYSKKIPVLDSEDQQR